MLFCNLMQSRVVSKCKICELLGHYRRGPNLQNSFRLTIHYRAIDLLLKRIPGLENVRVSRTYIEIDDAIGFVTLSLIQYIYVLCRAIIWPSELLSVLRLFTRWSDSDDLIML